MAKHITRFSFVFDKIINLLATDISLVKTTVNQIMINHINYSVYPKQLELFKLLFMEMLSEKLAVKFSNSVKEAWDWFFDEIILKEIDSLVHKDADEIILNSELDNPLYYTPEDITNHISTLSQSWLDFKSLHSVTYAAKTVFMRLYNEHDYIADLFRNRFTTAQESANKSTAVSEMIGDIQNDLVVGSAEYIAPELLTDSLSGNGPAADVWAIGVILFEFLAGIPPFHAESQAEVFENIIHRKINWSVVPSDVSPEVLGHIVMHFSFRQFN